MSAASAGAVIGCSSDATTGSIDAAQPADAALPADASPDAIEGVDGGTSCPATIDDALGPFYEPGAPMRTQIAALDEPGERLALEGVVVTAVDCTTPLAGVLLDIWQADKDGNYHAAGAEFRLRGQILTGADGRFRLETIRPGNYENGPGAWRPAHLHFLVSKPGYLPVTTQIYFAGDPFLSPNDGCPGCGSDDPLRIVPLTGNAKTGWQGELEIVLARS